MIESLQSAGIIPLPYICNKTVHQSNYMFATVEENLCKEIIPSCSLAHVKTVYVRLSFFSRYLVIEFYQHTYLCYFIKKSYLHIGKCVKHFIDVFLYCLKTTSISARSSVQSSDTRGNNFSGSGAELLSYHAAYLLGVLVISFSFYLSC